ncbi:hypothetical protein B0H10DRAFT_1999665 [Mycena sp. CBHHK59/15]|nr:hypothetical protein B0H10DRAFT_1999665 [Mycena sp. CBHHK59/15]
MIEQVCRRASFCYPEHAGRLPSYSTTPSAGRVSHRPRYQWTTGEEYCRTKMELLRDSVSYDPFKLDMYQLGNAVANRLLLLKLLS